MLPHCFYFLAPQNYRILSVFSNRKKFTKTVLPRGPHIRLLQGYTDNVVGNVMYAYEDSVVSRLNVSKFVIY